MTREEIQAHWEKIVLEAYQSGMPVSQWCREQGIRPNHFYRWTKKLGYTSNGQRTEKCPAINKEQPQQVPVPVAVDAPLFVEVPDQVLGGLSEPAGVFPPNQPLITIQAGSYQIGVKDGFDERTLLKVLEVMHYA